MSKKIHMAEVGNVSIEELIKATEETCNFIGDNMNDWVSTEDLSEIEKAIKDEVFYLDTIVREIYRRIVLP